jgi:ribosomal protein L37E
MNGQRTHVPCRVCGVAHSNPMSGSICPHCGPIEAAAHKQHRRDIRRTRRNVEKAAEASKLYKLNEAETVHDLREWIKEFVL